MKIVADTNTFIAVALEEPEKKQIIRFTVGKELVAPEVLPFEVGNALTAMVKKRALDPNEVISAWDVVQTIPVELRRIDIQAALGLAVRFNIYAYDAYFIECALSLRCPMLTLDHRMKMVARDVGIRILE
ncbi:MAG TPA: PIN domain-containing protein [Thermodesulforhabdus norvegica]|uniref:PIN domain-containing protein n=1 Tax=Thermodesulforhabdus norvegica TaxID=39841 RepID=A0A7C0WVV3_9BACT|nr:PIN domain-containing protein [Thermodesulforhabdus norvegica]